MLTGRPMEVESPNQENNAGPLSRMWQRLMTKFSNIARESKKLAQDYPRKVHCLKLGLAITIVSLIFCFNPLYEGFGVSAMWAVLTVIVVFEFSVGTTIGRGMNRMLATLLGGTLGVGALWISNHSRKIGEPILIATFVFKMAAIVTFARFFPKLKARYDYGLMIFILTFCLVSVSGYREEEVLHMAARRITTIAIGSCTSVFMCILICPVWIGEDLHNLIAANLEKLGNFLEGFAGEQAKMTGEGQTDGGDKSFREEFKSVLTSKISEESMATLARWEPRHGRFRFRHPWKHYLKVGSLARQCTYRIEAIRGYLNSDVQVSAEIHSEIQESGTKISSEAGKAMKELPLAMKTMTRSSSPDPFIAKAKEDAKTMESLLKTSHWEGISLLEIIPPATVASLLLEVFKCTEQIAEAVNELAILANFQMKDPTMTLEQQNWLRRSRRMAPATASGDEGQHLAITVGE